MYQPQSFQTFAKLKGIHLLKDDIVFIKKCLQIIPYTQRRKTLEKYADIWLQAMRECDSVILKQNLGRRKSNLWLLEQVNG
jgi:hypothetical protein